MDDQNQHQPSDQPVPEGADFAEEKIDGIGKQSPESTEQENSVHASGDDELSRVAAARALNLKGFAEMREYQDQIGRIVAWAQEQGAQSPSEIVAKINELQNTLGHGKNVYSLAVYAGLELEKSRIERQLKGFTSKK